MAETDIQPRPTEKMSNVELLLLRYKKQLEELKCLQQVTLASSQQTLMEEERQDSVSRTFELQKEVCQRSSFKSSQSLLLQRLQMGESLLHILFNEDAPIAKEERDYIKGLVAEQRELSASILAHLQKHCNEMRQEQGQLQAESRESIQLNRALMKDLSDLEQAPQKIDDENLKKLNEDVEQKTSYLTIVKSVLQGLIVGSGLNWAQDRELQELLLSLGN